MDDMDILPRLKLAKGWVDLLVMEKNLIDRQFTEMYCHEQMVRLTMQAFMKRGKFMSSYRIFTIPQG